MLGKSGLLLANGSYEKSYHYLQSIVARYPQPEIFDMLISLAFTLERPSEAKKRFFRSVMLIQDEHAQDLLQQKYQSLLK